MNASKPNSGATTDQRDVSVRGRQRRPATTKQAAATPTSSESAEVDFERHDTIPAPTWLDDGPEST
jgi:hypothetical protein